MNKATLIFKGNVEKLFVVQALPTIYRTLWIPTERAEMMTQSFKANGKGLEDDSTDLLMQMLTGLDSSVLISTQEHSLQ